MTYTSIVKATTIHTILSIAIAHEWKLHHLHVYQVSLHDRLNEKIYMKQLTSHWNLQLTNHIWKLHKVLYNHKQAPCN